MARLPKRKREDPSDVTPLDPAGASIHSLSSSLYKRPRHGFPSSAPPSISSAETASQGTWQGRKNRAQTRIQEYKLCGRQNEAYLRTTLNAALDWLPEAGREALANDIIDAEDDGAVWEVFENFRTGILQAGKFIHHRP